MERKRIYFFGVRGTNTIHDEIELREKTKERIDEIEKLRRKREKELENLFNVDNEAIDLLVELDIDKKEQILIAIKLEKLKISAKTIKTIRSQLLDIHLYQFMILK